MSESHILIRGAREHNLKNIDLAIPRHALTVITGVSGSGKSSLAFDTLSAEGQRRYVESLSAYARQFLSLQNKPDVDAIEGLSPSIAIEQKSTSRNPRSTVGTITEIYDYLRLLYARIGRPFCPTCHAEISSQTLSQMVDAIAALESGSRLLLLAPLVRGRKGEYRQELVELQKQGFTRLIIDNKNYEISELPQLDKNIRHTIEVVVDRLIVKAGMETRLADSLETALRLAQGIDRVELLTSPPQSLWFSERHACLQCNFSYPEIEPRLFSFNSPFGACAQCSGLGTQEFFDPQRLIHNPDLAGSGRWEEVLPLLEKRYQETEDEEAREALKIYRSTSQCPGCGGTRLRPESLNIRIGQLHIAELCDLPLRHTVALLSQLALTEKERAIAQRILQEILNRLDFLISVGLDYLALSRAAATLSGGEGQRIRLANQIGSGLVGVLYILDEPSIGLHQRDNQRLLNSLLRLRDLGNTVLLVEHDEEAIRTADYVIDLGPGPGEHGGMVVATGSPAEIAANPQSLTGQYLAGHKTIPCPRQRRAPNPQQQLVMKQVHTHNLRHLDITIPLGLLVCVTGVSGSGKSSLILDTLYPAALQKCQGQQSVIGLFDRIEGLEQLDKVIHVDQSPIGRTPRSNPATYTGLFTPIRELFAAVPEARSRGYQASRFSFNIKGGRCSACMGEGMIKIEMHFLPDLFVQCDSCHGSRYHRETLDIRYKAHNIAEILDLTVEQAATLFQAMPGIMHKLAPLLEVGLGYLRLGQAATTLSGGEAQRVKIARELAKRSTGKTLYILDEPTTGLHFDDIRKLLDVLQKLTEKGNSVIVIEHNLDVIKSADWVLDLGPEGGSGGGELLGCGTPEELAQLPISWTGQFLKPLLTNHLASDAASLQNRLEPPEETLLAT